MPDTRLRITPDQITGPYSLPAEKPSWRTYAFTACSRGHRTLPQSYGFGRDRDQGHSQPNILQILTAQLRATRLADRLAGNNRGSGG